MKIFSGIASVVYSSLLLSTVANAGVCQEHIEYNIRKFAKSEVYQCRTTGAEIGPVFDENLSQPGSIRVSNSSACISLGYSASNMVMPVVLVQDKASGFELKKPTNVGNGIYGTTVISAFIDAKEKTVTRADFDKQKMIARLTKWKTGLFSNTMIYNYNVACQRIK